MLSGETSIGRYPLQLVQMMDKIAREVESSRFFRPTPVDEMPMLGGTAGMLCRAACWAVSEKSRPLVIYTWSGATARFVSKLRPSSPIYALSPHSNVLDQLALAWGITGLLVPVLRSTDGLIQAGDEVLLSGGHVSRGDEVVVLAGLNPRSGATNFMKIHRVGEED
jgi:pyruvate kinase